MIELACGRVATDGEAKNDGFVGDLLGEIEINEFRIAETSVWPSDWVRTRGGGAFDGFVGLMVSLSADIERRSGEALRDGERAGDDVKVSFCWKLAVGEVAAV